MFPVLHYFIICLYMCGSPFGWPCLSANSIHCDPPLTSTQTRRICTLILSDKHIVMLSTTFKIIRLNILRLALWLCITLARMVTISPPLMRWQYCYIFNVSFVHNNWLGIVSYILGIFFFFYIAISVFLHVFLFIRCLCSLYDYVNFLLFDFIKVYDFRFIFLGPTNTSGNGSFIWTFLICTGNLHIHTQIIFWTIWSPNPQF